MKILKPAIATVVSVVNYNFHQMMTLLLYYYNVQLIHHNDDDDDDDKEDIRVQENSPMRGYRMSFSVSKRAALDKQILCNYN